jgi:pimeloyl-ACP methyl ester carboxylesterase
MASTRQTEEMFPPGWDGSRRARGAAVVITVALSLAGCGDDSDSAATGPGSSDYLDQPATMATVDVDVDGVPLSPVRDAGRRFMTRCVGDGDASVLLVSGWTAPQEEWSEVQAKVGSVAHVCSYDRLGVGESGPLPPNQTFETFAADIEILVDALDLARPIVIVGHSLGGPIAMTWASSHVSDTRGVVLLDAPDAEFFEWQGSVMTDQLKAEMGDPLGPASGDAEHVDRPVAYAELKELDPLGDTPLAVLTHDPTNPNTYEFALADVSPKEETSEAWLDAQHRWQALSDNSELVTVDGAGHSIHLDEPDSVVAAILATLE